MDVHFGASEIIVVGVLLSAVITALTFFSPPARFQGPATGRRQDRRGLPGRRRQHRIRAHDHGSRRNRHRITTALAMVLQEAVMAKRSRKPRLVTLTGGPLDGDVVELVPPNINVVTFHANVITEIEYEHYYTESVPGSGILTYSGIRVCK